MFAPTPSVAFAQWDKGFLADYTRRPDGTAVLSLNRESPWAQYGTQSVVPCDPVAGCTFSPPPETALGRTFSSCVVTLIEGCPEMSCDGSAPFASVPQWGANPALFTCPPLGSRGDYFTGAYTRSFGPPPA